MIDVDVWVRGAAGAVTQKMKGVSTDVASWTVADVKLLLEQMLKALDRARDPNSEPASVAMRGFSWIVSPDQGGVLVHLELQLGTASAGWPCRLGAGWVPGIRTGRHQGHPAAKR